MFFHVSNFSPAFQVLTSCPSYLPKATSERLILSMLALKPHLGVDVCGYLVMWIYLVMDAIHSYATPPRFTLKPRGERIVRQWTKSSSPGPIPDYLGFPPGTPLPPQL